MMMIYVCLFYIYVVCEKYLFIIRLMLKDLIPLDLIHLQSGEEWKKVWNFLFSLLDSRTMLNMNLRLCGQLELGVKYKLWAENSKHQNNLDQICLFANNLITINLQFYRMHHFSELKPIDRATE